MNNYTDASRDRWRREIATAKQSLTKDEFADWLYRRMNSAAPEAKVTGDE